jgi:hypothetical protein
MSNFENEVTLQLERGIHSARNFIAWPRGIHSALQYAVPQETPYLLGSA